MEPSDGLSKWREERRKAERHLSLLETKARILSETIREQRKELERTITMAIATQSRVLGFQANAEQIAATKRQIEKGEEQVEHVNGQVLEAEQRLIRARSEVDELERQAENKRLLQKSWDELAVLDRQVESKKSHEPVPSKVAMDSIEE